ncbi:methyltransferase domain-containing protein [Olsenella sp. An270]|uniref:tRNA (guanine(46)-N(7))-methyltransferase TrmB n=1 Tax=Olsenella sp. An270 TaxID=1965615 RepID=UPI000B384815|nr:methyltransferase domain-containing protein [Olsenella sp. An270]OUO59140.1 methyltransferase [Olsenella sp. An270]
MPHALHARLPKNFVLEERLERYGSVIELRPESWRGRWALGCAPLGSAPFREVRLDLGCGKGGFVVEAARREGDVLFVAMDSEPICVAYAAQRVFESGLPNVVVVPGTGMRLREFFSPGELSVIHLNFPTPFPRKRDAGKRMACMERLIDFREVLTPGGEVRMRTDSQPLFDFMLTQVPLAGYELLWESRDARSERPDDPASEYERRLGAQGARVLAITATPGPVPERVEQTAELSLAAYLPHDLDELESLAYAPHGMEATVVNLRNRAIRERSQSASTIGE